MEVYFIPDYIMDKNIEHFSSTDEVRKKVDKMQKVFESAKKDIETIITMLDEILVQEDEILWRGHTQHYIGCTRNLSLEEQEFLRCGNAKLEP